MSAARRFTGGAFLDFGAFGASQAGRQSAARLDSRRQPGRRGLRQGARLLRTKRASSSRSSRAAPISTASRWWRPAATRSARCRRARRSCSPPRRTFRSSASASARRSTPTPSSRCRRSRCASRGHGRQEGRHPGDRRDPAQGAARQEQRAASRMSRSSPIGADMSPLLTGQVDVVTGWLTNTTALKVLGPDRIDLRLWDSGVRLYAPSLLRDERDAQDQERPAREIHARHRQGLGLRL